MNNSKDKQVYKSYATMLRNQPHAEQQAKELIVGAVAPSEIQTISIPSKFDGRVQWKQYLSTIKNQGKCGFCYSCATVGSLSDRFALLSLNSVHTDLSASDMVMCMLVDPQTTAILQTSWDTKTSETFHKLELESREKFSCLGNTIYNAGRYLYVEGAPPESCVPDSLVSESSENQDIPFCETVEGDEFDYCADKITAQHYYRASRIYQIDYHEGDNQATEQQIMYDIYRWGPLAAGFLVYDDFINNYDGKSIYTTKGTGKANLGHAIRIVGWGEDQQDGRLVKYWIIANSWGAQWGENGYFRMERFLDGMDLEKNTISIIPDLPGLTYWKISSSGGLIKDNDLHARNLLGVGQFSFYPASATNKIDEGLLKGTVAPVVKSTLLPASYADFYSGKINTYNLKTIRRGYSESTRRYMTLKLVICFIAAFLLGLFIMWIWKRKHCNASSG